MRRTTFLTTVLGAVVVLYVLAALLYMAVMPDLNHDEHQFMASAYLVATQGLQPYRDFAYFHMPNLVYLYAWLLPLTDYPFLVIRLFTGACALAIAATIFLMARSILSNYATAPRLLIAFGSVLLFVNSPVLAAATAHVWNHTPATLCALLTLAFYLQALRRGAVRYFFLSGLSLGMAIGIRVSFAPMVVPFLVVLFLPSIAKEIRRWPSFAAFTGGGILANLPALYFLATSPAQFVFGNLGYATLNTLYRQELGFEGSMSLLEKLIYFVRVVLFKPGDLSIVLIALYIFLYICFKVGVKQIRTAPVAQPSVVLVPLVIPFLYIGSIAPTPLWQQYFFAPVPFLLVGILYGLNYWPNKKGRPTSTRLFLLCAVLSVAFGPFAQAREALPLLFQVKQWFPMTMHQVANEVAHELAAVADTNPTATTVLTLAPLYAVEAGAPIYLQFATGPFAWRVGHLLSPAERQKQNIISPFDLSILLEQEAPAAILLTNKRNDEAAEQPLAQAAQQLGFHPRHLSDGSTLWVKSP
ncbi:MAG: hypothetical protein R3E79_28480 [Caldilineaceae bacterium]